MLSWWVQSLKGGGGKGGGERERERDKICASRVNCITRLLSGYLSTAANHNYTAARPMS